jgi:hypothetical protein
MFDKNKLDKHQQEFLEITQGTAEKIKQQNQTFADQIKSVVNPSNLEELQKEAGYASESVWTKK